MPRAQFAQIWYSWSCSAASEPAESLSGATGQSVE